MKKEHYGIGILFVFIGASMTMCAPFIADAINPHCIIPLAPLFFILGIVIALFSCITFIDPNDKCT